MPHAVVSASVVKVPRQGVGQLVTAPPVRMPGSPFHAAQASDSVVTMCGLDASRMHRFDDVQWNGSNYGACGDCAALLDG